MEFLILGPLEVRDGQRTVRLGSAKQRALLGVLLLHANETVPVARLIDELWGERPPATAAKLVQGYVHALRKQLGEGTVQTRPRGYLLSVEPRALDLAEFERLAEAARTAPLAQAVELRRRALALWRGPPLADVELEGSARHSLARLAELRLATQLEQADAELERGRHAQVVGELEALLAEHPYQERLAGQLMLALYRSGRQADALNVYRGVRRRLSEELGLDPGQELRELEARILRQEPGLAPSPPAPPTKAVGGLPHEEGRPLPRRRWPLLLGTAGLVAAALLLGSLLALRSGDETTVTVPPNTLALIDPTTNQVQATVPVGIRPGAVAFGEAALWVANLDDKTVTRIDPQTRNVVRTIPVGTTPDDVAVGEDAVWLVNGRLGTLHRLDPAFNSVSEPIALAGRAIHHVDGGVAVGGDRVWAALADSTLARVDPRTLASATARVAGIGPVSVVVAFGSVWVATSDSRRGVQRFSPQTFSQGALDELAIGSTPAGLAAGAGSVWVVNAGDDTVTRIDPGSAGFNASATIEVGDRPTAVAVGARGVWVANTGAGTISRIDPTTNEVVATIEVGNAPAGLAVGEGMVAVAVQAP